MKALQNSMKYNLVKIAKTELPRAITFYNEVDIMDQMAKK